MGWTIPPADLMDWAALENLNQYVAAFNERLRAITPYPNATAQYNEVESGWDVQNGHTGYVNPYTSDRWAAYGSAGAWNFWVLQQDLEWLCTQFIDPDTLYISGQDYPTEMTLEEWRTIAGINVSGFKAVNSSGVTEYRRIQPGDVIGPWLFEELYNGLNILKRTYKYSAWTNGGSTNAKDAGATVYYPDAYIDAIGEAYANWNSGVWYGSDGYGPKAKSVGGCYPGDAHVSCSLNRRWAKGYLQHTWASSGTTCEIDWYAYASGDTLVPANPAGEWMPYWSKFDDNGDGLGQNCFTLWTSTHCDTDEITTSGALGTSGRPNAALGHEDVRPGGQYWSSEQGYEVTQQFAVLNWNFEYHE